MFGGLTDLVTDGLAGMPLTQNAQMPETFAKGLSTQRVIAAQSADIPGMGIRTIIITR